MDVDNTADKELSINIGELLVEARENLNLTSQDIAQQMNLANSIIEKIENNNFSFDFPVAFVRGYIKSYATKVGLDTGPMLGEFDTQIGVESPSLKSVKPISTFDVKRKEINSGHYLFKSVSILILLTFLSFAGWELWKRYMVAAPNSGEIQEQSISDISAQLNTVDDNSLNSDGLNESANEISNDEDVESTEDVELTADVVQNENPLGSDLNEDSQNSGSNLDQTGEIEQSAQQELVDTSNLIMTSLVLDFSADCWVRIVDARGEVIALGVKQSGKHMPVEGVAPFNVILGDPSVVTMNYAGRDHDLSGYRAGRRAEIILE